MKVKMPFKKRFKEPMLNGTKTFTSRTKRMGKIGDTFEAFGRTFIIKDIWVATLRGVSAFWEEEGCESKEDFMEIWKQIHPRKGWQPEQEVYVHIFKSVGGEG